MAKSGRFMYICDMEIGKTPPNATEEMLSRLQVQIVVSRREKLGAKWRLDLSSPFWRLYSHSRHGASIIFAGRLLRMEPGRLYLIPAWTRFQTFLSDWLSQDYIHFYLTGFPMSLQRRIFDRPITLPKDPLFSALCRRWQKGLQQKQGLAELGWTHALVHAALASATDKIPATSQALCLRWLDEASEVRASLECIDSRLDDPPSNAELARLCHLSTDHFIRRFRRAIGMAPARYGLERRVAVAAYWLIATSRTTEDIASSAGFADRFHFSRAFKAQFGLPPIAYRRMHWR